jgi:hypothetical protein
MYRVISSRAPYLVSKLRTLNPKLNGASKLSRGVGAPASTRLYLEVHQKLLGHMEFSSSSRHRMNAVPRGKRSVQSTFSHYMVRTLTRMQALTPTAIQVADGSVAMRWSESLVL